MENIIYIELRRRGFNVDVGLVEKEVSKMGKRIINNLKLILSLTKVAISITFNLHIVLKITRT